jgi:hypothetical protein
MIYDLVKPERRSWLYFDESEAYAAETATWGLLCSCKQVYSEYLPVLYTRLRFQDLPRASLLLRKGAPTWLAFVRDLEIDISFPTARTRCTNATCPHGNSPIALVCGYFESKDVKILQHFVVRQNSATAVRLRSLQISLETSQTTYFNRLRWFNSRIRAHASSRLNTFKQLVFYTPLRKALGGLRGLENVDIIDIDRTLNDFCQRYDQTDVAPWQTHIQELVELMQCPVEEPIAPVEKALQEAESARSQTKAAPKRRKRQNTTLLVSKKKRKALT